MIEFVLATGVVWTNPILVGVVVGIPTTVFGFKAYRRAEALDKAAALAATVASEGAAIQRVIDGLDRLVENLRDDNKDARQYAAELRGQLKECRVAYDELKLLKSRP